MDQRADAAGDLMPESGSLARVRIRRSPTASSGPSATRRASAAGQHSGEPATSQTGADGLRSTDLALGPTPDVGVELIERLETALEIAARLAASNDRAELLAMIVNETARGLHADAATIRLMREDRLEIAAWSGIPDAVARRMPAMGRSEGWIATVLGSGTVRASSDIRTDRQFGLGPPGRGIGIVGHAAAPLIHRGRVIGVLSAFSREPRTWTQGDLTLLTTLATHAATSLANAELFEETVARAAQLEVLYDASARLRRVGTPLESAQAIVEEISRIIDNDDVRVYLLEPPDLVTPIVVQRHAGDVEPIELEAFACRLGEGFAGWVAAHGEPILVGDINRDPRGAWIPGTEVVDESMVVVPMRHDGVTLGVIALSKLGLDAFGPDDMRLLTILADQAAIAIGSARLLARTEALAGELRRMLDMSSELSGSLESRQVADLMAGHLARAMSVEECIISYWDRDAGQVESLGTFPADRLAEIASFFAVADYPQTLRVLETQEAVIIDAEDPDADPAEVALMTRDGSKVLAMLPLVAKGQSIGLVELVSNGSVRFDDERLGLARTMANEAAMALENARLYEDARKLADRDRLTGFYNHRFLHERLGEEVVRTQRGKRPLSLLMLDLDDFKLVNDTFGHLFGDSVLAWTADLIRSTLRASDIPARYGGDEFAIILPDTAGPEARHAADRILEAFRDRAFVGEQRGPVPIGASIGVATFPAAGRTATDLIAAADQALYRVKRDGGHDAARADDPTD